MYAVAADSLLHAQAPAPPAASAPARAPVGVPGIDALAALKYRSIGPSFGGRVSRVAGVAGDPSTFYAATASGGVWQSVDGGLTWKPVFDSQPVSSIGSLAIAPSNPKVIYVGSGEANIRGNVAAGNGIYRSLDGGKTWTHVWTEEGQIGTMVVHPTNPDVAYAAVLGRTFGPNPQRGIFRTRDGGRTWQQVLTRNADTGASDVAMDPNNPNVLFAGFWQARRRPWDLTSGGPGSSLYVSRDGGDTWTELRGKGLPEGIWGKVGVAIAPSDSRRVYALIEAEDGGLFRSDDGGDTWTHISKDRKVRQRPWYYSTMTVNPSNPDDVWFPQVPMVRTIDGGRTLKTVSGFRHGDHHDIWIDPRNPRRMIDGNDGGVELSNDGGETWTPVLLPLGQFYHVTTDTRVPFRVAGAMQDLGTVQGPINSLTRAGLTNAHWYDVGGGEAGHVVSKPDDPDVVYAGEYLGYISRYDDRTKQARNVSTYPENGSGHGAEDLKYRFQWTAPIAVSPHDPNVVYHGANVLFKTTDGGQTWSAISGDLTRNDRSKQAWSGGPITGDNTGVEYYCTIFAIAESPVAAGTIWTGSDDGLLQVTRDGGGSWTNVTASMPGMPEWGTVATIEPSHFDAGTAYVVVDAHRTDDVRPYLYKTGDFGRHWVRLDAGMPRDTYLHSVREDPRQRGLLFVGTERGVVFSADDGATWRSLQLNLPPVAVHDLAVKDDALVVATHGRSLWVLDDLVAVRRVGAKAPDEVTLLPPSPAIRWRYSAEARLKPAGENPPEGATIYYFLKAKPSGPLTIEILDAGGRVVRTLSSVKTKPENEDDDGDPDADEKKKDVLATDPGIQRAVWDLAWEGVKPIPRAKLDAGDPEEGPLAVPGTYTVRLTVDGRSLTAPLTIQPDPRVHVTDSELQAQLTFALKVRDDLSKLTAMVARVRSIRTQITQQQQAWKGKFPGDMGDLAVRILDRCNGLEGRLHNPKAEVTYDILAFKGGAQLYSRLSPLFANAIDGDGAPTQGMQAVYATQAAALTALETEVEALVSTDVAALNDAARKAALPFIVTAPPEAATATK